jgi:hypothetical protein
VTADPNAGEVVQPVPTVTTVVVGEARIPNPETGTTLKLVTLDIYSVTGLNRFFFEPGPAIEIAQRMVKTANHAKAGLEVVNSAESAKVLSIIRGEQ